MTRIVFMGSPEFALPTLAMLAEQYEVVGVYTQPDKPAGRGQQLAPPLVRRLAQERSLPVFQSRTLHDQAVEAQLAALRPDLVVVAAFGLFLPKFVLELPPHRCINVHASLLPKYRGAAPINAVILNGEAETGITLMLMDEGIDTGPMLARASLPIEANDTAGTLTTQLAKLGARLLEETLPRWLAGAITPQPQDHSQATFAPKLSKQDEQLNWSLSALELDRRVRALAPQPGTFTTWNGKLLRVIRTQVARQARQSHGAVGTVIQDGQAIGVMVGDGVLQLVEVQLEGKRAMPAADFARGQLEFVGSVLGG
jgi:methionyl-tRNA formyltransferase